MRDCGALLFLKKDLDGFLYLTGRFSFSLCFFLGAVGFFVFAFFLGGGAGVVVVSSAGANENGAAVVVVVVDVAATGVVKLK